MSSLAIAAVVMTVLMGGAVIGLVLHVKLPDHHLDSDSRDVVKMVMGLIATLTAVVLSLLIASAKNSYEAQERELQDIASKIVMLDRALAHYGEHAQETRKLLRQTVTAGVERIWPAKPAPAPGRAPQNMLGERAEALYDYIQRLPPGTEPQTATRAQALRITESLGQTSFLIAQQSVDTVTLPFLIVLVFWVSFLFLGFGLFARTNATVLAAIFIGALSVSGAVFLILELDQPYDGLIQLPDTIMRDAVAQLGRP